MNTSVAPIASSAVSSAVAPTHNSAAGHHIVDNIVRTTSRAWLSHPATFWLKASIIVSFLAGSSVPTPLYPLYQAEWGFSPITVTMIFGIYAVAVLAALLTVGSLSDYIGRRPVLLYATLVQAATMLMFATATSVTGLLFARVVQGLATGAAAAAVGAGMLDIDRARGTTANAVAPMTGTASGALIAGLMVQFLPAPTHLVYLMFFVIFVAQAAGAYLMPETTTPRSGALASLRPQFNLPSAVRTPFLIALPVLVASWSLAGFYGSLGPAMMRGLLGSSSSVLAGLTLFTLAGGGATAVLMLRNWQPRPMMMRGAGALLLGTCITLSAMALGSAAVFFAGAIITGTGFGLGFQGAVRSVVSHVGPQERAGVLSIIYVACYLAMGLPAVIAGFGVVYGGGLLATSEQYGAAVIVLAGLALTGTLMQRPKPA